jgi:acetate kinase
VGLEAALDILPGKLQVAVFDTAFHRSLPPYAYLYAVPYDLYEQNGVRRYGFHGTSHAYVAERSAELLDMAADRCNLISLHLGNGCSASAVKQGRSVDTSMGMTPLEGLVMGTRCGDVDPALHFFLIDELGMDPGQVHEVLNKHSGLAGLSGGQNDMREILLAAEKGEERSRLALDVFCYRVKKYIGAYFAVLGRLDALAFTAGIGENSPEVRRRICGDLEHIGLRLDEGKNEGALGREAVISCDDSPVTMLVVPTDEELKIAIDTYRICTQGSSRG